MKFYIKKLKVFTLLIMLLVSVVSIEAQAIIKKNYDPVVQELAHLYEKDKNFKTLVDNALSSAVAPLGGWHYSPYGDTSKLYKWSDKNVNDLLDFFQSWISFVPDETNGMQYYYLEYGLCYNNISAIKLFSAEPGLSWTRKFVLARGAYMDSTASITDHKKEMDSWHKSLGNNWDNFQPPHSTTEGYKGYKTFNEFFIRDLKNDTIRPISQANNSSLLVAPADGVTNVINYNLNTNSMIHTKYDEYLSITQLLDGSKYSKYFDGGTATATVLMPDDYHHYHSPVDGMVVETKNVDSDGIYLGMDGKFDDFNNNGNIGGYKSKFGVFGLYHRGYYIIKTKHYGYVAMIPIGLDDISSINFEKKFDSIDSSKKPIKVKKGEKVGHFAYGGSTVLLIFEAGVFNGIKLNQGTQLGVIKSK